jgi:Tol biopolymer transport system component
MCACKNYTRLFLLLLFTLSFALLACWLPARVNATPLTGTTTRVSIASDGTQGNGHSWQPSISGDGRYVAFHSDASNLVSGNIQLQTDVFVHDLHTGQTSHVSVASDGTHGNNQSFETSISADGRYVAFVSVANNLVPGDTNGHIDVFIHDRQTRQTSRVSIASDGTQGNNHSRHPSVSANGRYVAFRSSASNLVPGDTNGIDDVFIHDRQTAQTSLVSVASNGTQGNAYSGSPSMSVDGRYVAFYSYANNMVASDTNNEADVFIHDRQFGQTSLISVASDGRQGNNYSGYPSISADGRYVAFSSDASNLIPGDTNQCGDIFIHNRPTGQTIRVSVASDGTQANDGSLYPNISADGRYIAFQSWANNLVPGDTNGDPDIFIHDWQTDQTTRVSVASDGTQANSSYWGSNDPSTSADGRFVAFHSSASNLVTNDTNAASDIFVHDRGTSAAFSISGRITDAANNPMSSVNITTNTGQSATTDSNGDYTISGLTAATYTLIPSKTGYIFSPATRTVTIPPSAIEQDFTALEGHKLLYLPAILH